MHKKSHLRKQQKTLENFSDAHIPFAMKLSLGQWEEKKEEEGSKTAMLQTNNENRQEV